MTPLTHRAESIAANASSSAPWARCRPGGRQCSACCGCSRRSLHHVEHLGRVQLSSRPRGCGWLRHNFPGPADAGDRDSHFMTQLINGVAWAHFELVSKVQAGQPDGASRFSVGDIRVKQISILRGGEAQTPCRHVERHRTVVHHRRHPGRRPRIFASRRSPGGFADQMPATGHTPRRREPETSGQLSGWVRRPGQPSDLTKPRIDIPWSAPLFRSPPPRQFPHPIERHSSQNAQPSRLRDLRILAAWSIPWPVTNRWIDEVQIGREVHHPSPKPRPP